ncbi:hypothetical protein SLEP1_g6244 [Rubroshorea leprosula]|uniref:MADS-box domain-containing protein n=1 Tax=Rubroshorea leprosula TaxID=152421 RepID=A0AAV5HZ39_9ROSI|nr:hypothetical protein SLEP1_g6244 [Rubroshorea leprosula]
MAAPGKKTRGRQKIEMKKIENEDDKLITFSKRRTGIYKKASELVTLCGAEIGFVVFSPAGKPFSFGHPSIESIVNKYLNENPPPNDNTHPLVEAHRKMKINQLTHQYNEIEVQLDSEMERGKMLDKMNAGRRKGWWEKPMDQMNLEELKQFGKSLENLRDRVARKFNEKLVVAAAAAPRPPPQAMMDPTQMMNYPYGTNIGNDIAGPSYYVPGPPSYGFPRERQF